MVVVSVVPVGVVSGVVSVVVGVVSVVVGVVSVVVAHVDASGAHDPSAAETPVVAASAASRHRIRRPGRRTFGTNRNDR